jgi:hypothetical protein
MAMSDGRTPAGLVHGTGRELVEPDWDPLECAALADVLAGRRFTGAADTTVSHTEFQQYS